MRLRDWQHACLNDALTTYEHGKHFMCLATPGAGKTLLAAVLAKSLIDCAKIDFILCFAPSLEVSQSVAITFSHTLGRRFDGRIGAAGGTYTYQHLLYLNSDFWDIFERHNVLVVLDEVHHCAGTEFHNANSWGLEILMKIQDKARFTLALSGTPWRSDDLPIVLANYSRSTGKVKCGFEYNLRSAVIDGVCRTPRVILIDHDRIRVSVENEHDHLFGSFEELVRSNLINYEDLIQDRTLIASMLKAGHKRLMNIRNSNPKAAGLIVATSVNHARVIAELFGQLFNLSVRVVTYKDQQAAKIIDNFRYSSDEWIVSVGMISEGTDIPRLQVCCHLSAIKTEMHYRQVLGRILRMTNDVEKCGWLFTFSEPKLVEFAMNLEQEIPDCRVVQFDKIGSVARLTEKNRRGGIFAISTQISCSDDLQPVAPQREQNAANSLMEGVANTKMKIDFSGAFRERIISTFSSPF